ncbi:MAG: AraC family transcriptional regulator [Acidimicrobiia bacterium]|nr:AraC family transcriptional regulator [Acidimicrobiia bacterium]
MTDALTDALRAVRMESSVFSRASLAAPWGVEAGTMTDGVFHAVVRGRAWAQLTGGGDPIALERGDIVLMPFGHNHLMTDEVGRPARPIDQLTTIDDRGMGQLVVEGDGAHTSLICGSVRFEPGGAHPLLSVLPPMIHARDVDGSLSTVIERLIGMIASEVDEPVPGSETVIARLTDVLVIYVLREYIRRLEGGQAGWLGALRDAEIGQALGLMHRRPEASWTAEALARAVGLSRSAFFSRFRAAVGETPSEYLTRWRVQVACRILRDERVSVASVAARVGYQTEASFSNAFVRVMGVRPGAYKRAA